MPDGRDMAMAGCFWRFALSIELNPNGVAFSPTYTEADAAKQGAGSLGPIILGVQTYYGQGKQAGQLLAGDGKEFRTKLSSADQKAATLIAAKYSSYYANKYTNQTGPSKTTTVYTPSSNPVFTTYDINGQPVVYDQNGYKLPGAVGPNVDGTQTFYSTSGSATELVTATGQDFRSGLNAAAFAQATLDAYGVASLSPTDIAALPAASIGNLSAGQVGELNASQTSALSALQLQTLSYQQLNALSTAGVQGLSQGQIAALQQNVVATPNGNGDLSYGYQANALTASIVANLSVSQISTLPTASLQALLPDQLSALTPSQIGAFGAGQLNALTATQIQQLSASQFSGISLSQFSGLSDAFVQSLTTAQLQSLSEAQIDSLPHTVATFTPGEVSSLALSQLNALTRSDVQALSNDQLNALGYDQLRNLSQEFVQSLTSGQISTLLQNVVTNPYGTGDLAYGGSVNALLPSVIGNLSDSQISSLTSSNIQALLPDQLGALTPHQISTLSGAQLNSLTITQIQGLSSGQFSEISNAQWSEVSDAFVQSLTPQQLQSLSEQQISSLPDQVAAFSPIQISSLTSTQINAFSAAQTQALSTDQLNALGYDQLNNLSQSFVQNLTSGQISTLQQNVIVDNYGYGDLSWGGQADGLLPSIIANISDAQLSALAPAQIQNFLPDQIGALTAEQVSKLSGSQLSVLAGPQLTAAQFAAITNTQWAQVSDSFVQALTTPQLQSLSEAQIFSLADQVAAFTPAQIASLTSTQLNAFSAAQTQALSTDQLNALGYDQLNNLSQSFVQNLTSGQISVLQQNVIVDNYGYGDLSWGGKADGLLPSIIANISDAQLSALAPAQIQNFLHDQIGALTTDQVSKLSGSQLSVLTGSQLTDAQFAAITSTQWGQVSDSFVQALTTPQLHSLSEAQISSLADQVAAFTPAQIASLTSTQLNAFSAAQTQALSTDQLNALGYDQLNNLSQSFVQNLASGQISVLQQNVIVDNYGYGDLSWGGRADSLLPSIVASLSQDQVSNLTTQTLGSFLSDQAGSLSDAQVQSLNYLQAAAIAANSGLTTSGAAIAASTAQLTPAFIAALDANGVGVLATWQLDRFLPEQIAAFGASQIQALSATQIGAFTTAQIPEFAAQQISAFGTTQLQALSAPQIQSLNAAQVTALSATQIPEFSTVQIAEFTPSQIRQFSGSQISSLTNDQVSALTTNQIGALSGSQIIAFTGSQIPALSTSQISSLSTAQVAAFSTGQIPAFTVGQLQALSSAQIQSLAQPQIAALTTSQVEAFVPAQIAEFLPTQISEFTAAQVPEFSAQQLQALTPAQIQGLTANQVSALTTSQIASISPSQVSSLTSAQLGVLSVPQVQALTTSQISSLTNLQISAFNAPQVASFSGLQLLALSASQIQSLSASQIQTLSGTQIGSFTSTQIGQFTAAQTADFLPIQIASLRAAQIGALKTAQIESLSGLQLNALSAAQVQSFTQSQVRNLTDPQVAALLPGFISALTASQLQSLTPDQLGALSASQLQALTTAQVPSLTGAQLQSLAPDQISILTTDQLSALTVAQIQSFALTQVPGFSTAQIAGVSPNFIRSLTGDQLRSLTAQQFKVLTPGQIVALATDIEYAGNPDEAAIHDLSIAEVGLLSASQEGALRPDQISSFTATQFQAFAPDQLGNLSYAQTRAISIAQIQALSGQQLQGLSADQIASLDPSRVGALAADQFAALSATQVGALTTQQVGVLSSSQVGSASYQQIAALSAAQLDALTTDTFNTVTTEASTSTGVPIDDPVPKHPISRGNPTTTPGVPPTVPAPQDAYAYDLNNLQQQVSQISTRGTLAVALGSGDNVNTAVFWNGDSWYKLPGDWDKVIVSGDGSLWGISTSGALERYVVNAWVNQGVSATDVAAADDGSVYIAGSPNSSGGNIYKWSPSAGGGVASLLAQAGTWSALSGTVTSLAVSSDGSLWGIGSDGTVSNNLGGNWTSTNTQATAIAAGGDGSVFAIGATNSAGGNLSEWNGSSWVAESATLTQIEVDSSGAVFGVDANSSVAQRLLDSTWSEQTVGPIGTTNYFGSSNVAHHISASNALNALQSISEGFSAGAPDARAAAVGLQSIVQSIKNGTANPEQTLIFNSLANTLTWGNPDGQVLQRTTGPVVAGANSVATLLGALITSSGAEVDSNSLSFLSVGAAMEAYKAEGVASLDSVRAAFGDSVDPALTRAGVGGILDVLVSSQAAPEYMVAANAISAKSGSMLGVTRGVDSCLQNLYDNLQLGDAGAGTITSSSDQQIAALTIDQISTFSVQQISALSEHQIELLSADQLNALRPSQISSLTQTQLAAISSSALAGVFSSFLNALDDTQVGALSASQVAVINASEFSALSASFIGSLSIPAVDNLSQQQLGNLGADQINGFTNAQVFSLSHDQLASLNQGEVNAVASNVRPEYSIIDPTPPFEWPFPQPVPDFEFAAAKTEYVNSTPKRVQDILGAVDVSVSLDAHWIQVLKEGNKIPFLHTWISLTGTVHGIAETVTLSWEPKVYGLIDLVGGTQLIRRVNADNQLYATNSSGTKTALLTPTVLKPPPGKTEQEFATLLAKAYYAYNNRDQYWAAPTGDNEYNSNSGTTTLLAMAGYTPSQISHLQVLVIANPALQIAPVVKATLADPFWCPGWGRVIPLKDFGGSNWKDVKIAFAPVTIDPVAALLGSSYVRNMVLKNPTYAKLFSNDLLPLQEVAGALKGIENGGVLNVLSGGLDLYILGVRAGIFKNLGLNQVNQYGDPTTLQSWLNLNGAAALADVGQIVDGFKQGGIDGAIEVGVATDQLVWAVNPLLHILNFATISGGTVLPIAIVAGLIALAFGGNHDNPQQMPDKYDTARYLQYVGELVGSANTAYAAPYDPSTDPIQSTLGGASELAYIQNWVKGNLNSTSVQVQQEARKLLPLYGDSGTGQLGHQTDIGNVWVEGGTEAGTYVTVHDDAGQAISEIELLNAEDMPKTFAPPTQDYGAIDWTPIQLPSGSQGAGYWGQSDSGQFFYFDPSNNNLYSGADPGPVTTDSAWIGDVRTFDFVSGSAVQGAASQTPSYGGAQWHAFTQTDGSIGYWSAVKSTTWVTPDPVEPPEPAPGTHAKPPAPPKPYPVQTTSYYYFGQDNKLYTGTGAGNLARQTLVGNAATYDFAAGGDQTSGSSNGGGGTVFNTTIDGITFGPPDANGIAYSGDPTQQGGAYGYNLNTGLFNYGQTGGPADGAVTGWNNTPQVARADWEQQYGALLQPTAGAGAGTTIDGFTFGAPDANGIEYSNDPTQAGGAYGYNTFTGLFNYGQSSGPASGDATGWIATPQAARAAWEQQFGAVLTPPPPTYGGLNWNSIALPTGGIGYTAAVGNGTYYYFGPDNKLFIDAYSGQVRTSDLATNFVGDVTTYDFNSGSGPSGGSGLAGGGGKGSGAKY